MPTRSKIEVIEEIRDPYPADFASRLKIFRKGRGIKQTELAEKLGIDIQKCRRYEKTKGEREDNGEITPENTINKGKNPEPDVETLKAIASVLKITVDELIGYKPAATRIATDILNKASIPFTESAEGTFALYRYKTKEESDMYYLDPYSKEWVSYDDLDPDLLEAYARDNNCTFYQLPDHYGFRVYLGNELYCPEVPVNVLDPEVYASLSRKDVLNAVATKNTQNIKVLYDDGSGTQVPMSLQETFSKLIAKTTLTAPQLKSCVFEAKRRTDTLVKGTLNAAYASFYPTVFWDYLSNDTYSTWSVRQISQLPERFPERLRELRKSKGYSQTDLANDIGLSLKTYNRYETQDAQPSIDMLKRLALKLGVSIDTLTGFEMDYINEALNFLKKVNITCEFDNKTDQYRVQVPGREAKERSAACIQFCAYKAKEYVDRLIGPGLKMIFDETFRPIFWELVNQHENSTPGIIIDENNYEPYLYELDLMNRPTDRE